MKVDWIGVLKAISKHWKDTIGSLAVLVVLGFYLNGSISERELVVSLATLWVGSFVNRKLDPMGVFKKEEGGQSE